MSGIKKVNLSTELQESFLCYAEEVIRNRAIPDIRDGLKPVHRRILWAMWEMGCKNNSTMKKCARVVGDCFKYHPHSDIAIFDALVRLAQPFAIGEPLISCQGNIGSIDYSSEYASARYLECKLSEFSEDILFKDIDFDTVEMIDNYTAEFKEPTVLPARIPLILLTGSNGIAVGMKCDFLPHNLKEVCDGIIACLNNKDITTRELMKEIPAPDFPLGGSIIKSKDIHAAYDSGNGMIEYKATAEQDGKTIIFDSIPYGTDKSDIIKDIAGLIAESKIEGISDVRDESEAGKVCICVDIKKAGNYQEILDQIYKRTKLSKNFVWNAIAISNKKPKLVGLLDIFKTFIDFRREIIKKRTLNQKIKAEKRKEIVEGILIALANPEEVIKIVRTNDDPVHKLQTRFKLTDVQANYIYNMQVKRFSKQDAGELELENKELEKLIEDKKETLKNKDKVDKIIEEETLEIKEKYGVKRKTILVKREKEDE